MKECLYVLRVCRKERYRPTEIDYLFYSIVLPNLTYGFSVHGASDTDLNVFQQFYTDAVSYVYVLYL